MPATLSIVCLLLSQSGSGFDFEPPPRAPALRGATQPPALKVTDAPAAKPKSPEPKTIIQPSTIQPAQPSTRLPPAAFDREEPDRAESDYSPPSSFMPRATRPPAAARIELEEPGGYDPPRRADVASRAKSTTPAQEPNRGSLATNLIRNALHNPEGVGLTGSPISLHATLERASERGVQTKIVKAYWLLAAGTAELNFALTEAEFLAGLPAPRTPHERAILAAARATATAHLRQAELAASTTQQDLAEAAQITSNNLPLPADVPYVGNYRTSFKELFANRPAPAALRRIDRTLPPLRELIESQAAAVSAAEKSLYAISQAYENGEADLALVVETHKQLRRQRREFLVAVRDYNFSIADYALAVANPGTSRSAVVAMLIEAPARTKSVLVPTRRDVLPASSEEEFYPEERNSTRFTPDSEIGEFRTPVIRDLVPVPPPR